MRFYWFAIPFALLAVPSFAQQPAPPTTTTVPSQLLTTGAVFQGNTSGAAATSATGVLTSCVLSGETVTGFTQSNNI
jgi:hypothetical protein